jgi:hypothetical protein
MKHTFSLASLLLVTWVMGGCIPQDLRTFTIEIDETVTVPGTSPLANTALQVADVLPQDLPGLLSQSLNQELDTQNIPTDAIESLQFSVITLTVTDPEENGNQVRDLSFFDSLVFKIADNTDSATIAQSETDAFTEGVITYTFPNAATELLPFFAANDSLEIQTDVTVNDHPNFETDVLFHFEIAIIAKGF